MAGHFTYLAFELVWALPVLGLQWLAGYRYLRPRAGTVVLAAAVVTAYLSCADRIAIGQGIWTIHADRVVGWSLAGLPVEEALFFLLTNLMVIQTVVIVRGYLAERTRQRSGKEGGVTG